MDLLDALKQYQTGQPKPLDPQVEGALEASFPPPTLTEQLRRAALHKASLLEQLDASLKVIEQEKKDADVPLPVVQVVGELRPSDRQAPVHEVRTPVEAKGTDVAKASEEYHWPFPFHLLTGAAGSGKTWKIREQYQASAPGSVILTTSTGIAAVNLGDAVTINSQLGYFDTSSMQQNYTHGVLQQRLRRLRQAGVRRLILDEVSMFEAEQLTCLVRAINELNSEAGTSAASADYFDDTRQSQELGLTLVGDFLQLPPIKGKYAFQSPEWHHFDKGIETLTEIRRQGNEDFINALRACRAQDVDHVCDYFRSFISMKQDNQYTGTTIFAKNDSVERMNKTRLDELPGSSDHYQNARSGKERGEWKHIPLTLDLKPNAQVMILSNRYEERELLYANGDAGIYLGKNGSGDAMVQLSRTGEATPVKWITRQNKLARKDAHYVCANPQCNTPAASGHVKRCPVCGSSIKKDLYEIVGEITYMPLRLAYASTVHKTQGLTLETVQIAIGDHFFTSYGMLYVALSRARGPEGLKLVGTIDQLRKRVRMDPAVERWR